jgi:type I restriction enzyme S subunit
VPQQREAQRRIASILSAYDDLIENNTRRIAILEEMTRRLYEEWFVHFRFPGHERVRMVESALGPIPEGWGIPRLEELAIITMGQSPRSEFYNEDGEGLPFHQGVTNFGAFFPLDKIYCTSAGRIAHDGDILFSVRAPVGRINIARSQLILGRGLSAIRAREDFQHVLLCALRHRFQEEDTIGGGTIFKAVTKEDMQGIRLIWPDGKLILDLQQIVGPMWQLIRIISEQNTNLRAQRDLLLPKLISGEIDVSEVRAPEADAEAA